MPVLFIGHGSPMNAIETNGYTESLRALGADLPRPASVLVVSAHWLTRGTFITASAHPEQIYDFFGFPGKLYSVDYRARGNPELARRIADRIPAVQTSPDRGLDHAAWAVLKHLYPNADVPVLELSLDTTLSEQEQFELAKRLAPFRNEGVLIVGSGNVVHNLSRMAYETQAPVPGWAVRFDEAVKSRLVRADDEALVRWRELGADAETAVPTTEHYLPMLAAMALREKGEAMRFIHEGFQHGTVSMRCFAIGREGS